MGENAIAKVGWTHDAIIDLIIAHPEFTQNELCERVGYTPGWMSRVINSDAFQNRLAGRRHELVDPVVTQGLNERMRAVSSRSADVILDALDQPNPSKAVALKALEISARAAHYGAKVPRIAVQVNVQNNPAGSRPLVGGGQTPAEGPVVTAVVEEGK